MLYIYNKVKKMSGPSYIVMNELVKEAKSLQMLQIQVHGNEFYKGIRRFTWRIYKPKQEWEATLSKMIHITKIGHF